MEHKLSMAFNCDGLDEALEKAKELNTLKEKNNDLEREGIRLRREELEIIKMQNKMLKENAALQKEISKTELIEAEPIMMEFSPSCKCPDNIGEIADKLAALIELQLHSKAITII